MKVAIVADWLTNLGGAERVVKALHEIFPQAPIFTTLYNPKKLPGFENANVITSWLQKIPFAKTHHQYFVPLMTKVVEKFDLSGFDLIISSSHSVAKGIIPPKNSLHISYCHTPMRYVWEPSLDERLSQGWLKPKIRNYLKGWDIKAAKRVDYFIANSKYTARRIKKYYGKEVLAVIYPPVETGRYHLAPENEIADYFLMVGRLIPYKQFDLAIKAFNKLKLPLKIVGRGPEEKKLKAMAGPTIEFLGEVEDKKLPDLYARALAFVFPAEEDFGIVSVEANASGRPVIAFAKGGATESQKEGVTAIFFHKQTLTDLVKAIKSFHPKKFDPKKIRTHALKFDEKVFKSKIKETVKRLWNLETI